VSKILDLERDAHYLGLYIGKFDPEPNRMDMERHWAGFLAKIFGLYVVANVIVVWHHCPARYSGISAAFAWPTSAATIAVADNSFFRLSILFLHFAAHRFQVDRQIIDASRHPLGRDGLVDGRFFWRIRFLVALVPVWELLLSGDTRSPASSLYGATRNARGHLNRRIDGTFEIVRVVSRRFVSIAEVHAIRARAHLAQSEPEMARDRFGFLEHHGFAKSSSGSTYKAADTASFGGAVS
jgi:hypothetical protein